MQKDIVVAQRGFMLDHCMNFVADIPTVFHCHHFNLFWDQTIDDALGAEVSANIRTAAAREAFYDLLTSLAQRVGANSVDERLDLARSVFSGFGQGDVSFDVSPNGGNASADYLHYSFAWNEKYGRKVRRKQPLDAMASGFLAAATEVAFGVHRESVRCREHDCVATRHRRCNFELELGDPAPLAAEMARPQVEAASGEIHHGMFEDRIAPLVAGLREFTSGVLGDDRGLIQAFGLFVTQAPTTYYSRSGFDAYRHIQRTAPQSAPVMRALLREAGHVCAFNTLGGIMLSPEWEALAAPPSGDPDETLVACMAIVRALGFGRWTVREFEPGRRLVVDTPSGYESSYYVTREGRATGPMCFLVQGAVLAIMQLIERVPWTDRPELTDSFYGELFRNGLPWQVEETQCICKGDPQCEIVVTRR